MFAGYVVRYAQLVERQESERPGPPVAEAERRGRRNRPDGSPPARHGATNAPGVSKPLVNPRLTADPRLRIWITRTAIAAAFYIGFQLALGWKYAVSAAVIYTIADTVYRSRTTSVIPAAVRVTAAQRSTQRRLKMLRPAGYMELNACRIPGTETIIDHIVVGPAGVFTVDSERLDKRLPIRVIGGMMYHGPVSQEGRIDHAEEEAREAAGRIGAELGKPVRVRPVMIIYGPPITWKVMRFKNVDTFDGSKIGQYFRHQSKDTAGRHLSPDTIGRIFAAAARVLPPIENG
jgi:hypothetical protein